VDFSTSKNTFPTATYNSIYMIDTFNPTFKINSQQRVYTHLGILQSKKEQTVCINTYTAAYTQTQS